jgi:hypothetical protein
MMPRRLAVAVLAVLPAAACTESMAGPTPTPAALAPATASAGGPTPEPAPAQATPSFGAEWPGGGTMRIWNNTSNGAWITVEWRLYRPLWYMADANGYVLVQQKTHLIHPGNYHEFETECWVSGVWVVSAPGHGLWRRFNVPGPEPEGPYCKAR